MERQEKKDKNDKTRKERQQKTTIMTRYEMQAMKDEKRKTNTARQEIKDKKIIDKIEQAKKRKTIHERQEKRTRTQRQ